MVALVEHTLFGTVDKVQIAIDRIKQFEPPEGYYVAFSGGKDSIVVKDLIMRSGVKAEYHFNLTTVDPPELIYYIREHHKDVEVHKPEKTMWQLIEKNRLPPLKQQRWCCRLLKEGGGSGRFTITGVRWAESTRRASRRMTETCATDNSKRYLHPIIDWSDADVWAYIRSYNLPYCSLYDEGFTRVGCILCPQATVKRRAREIERWPKYADAYRRACDKAFQRIIDAGKMPRNFKSGAEMFEWWTTNKLFEKQDPDQTVMFE